MSVNYDHDSRLIFMEIKPTGVVRPALLAFGILLALGAASISQTAQAQRPDEATANFNRGKVLFDKSDFAGAIDSFSKAIELKPAWAEPYFRRGYARRMHGELNAAVQDFDKATELDARTTRNNLVASQTYTNHGQVLALNLQLDEAITDFDKAINLLANDARPYYERAQARLLLEDFNGAIADYSLYVEKEKYDIFGRARGYSERGLAKHLLGHDQEGEEDAKEALKLVGKDTNFILDQLAFLERQVNELHKARVQKKKGIG